MEIKIEKLTLIQETSLENVYELILEDDEELSMRDMKLLNINGYVYHSELLSVDYDDQEDDGSYVSRYMNIYYFSKAAADIHNSQFKF